MKNKGFTLIELMISITIMLIMTATVLFNYNKFNESSLLNAFAYDMSLTIRQAQVYGGAVKEGTTDQSAPIGIGSADDLANNFRSSYGVHFDMNPAPPVTFPLVLFVDSDGSGQYDLGEEIQSYTFQRGIRISDLCAANACGKKTLDITFLRPDPEAIINGEVASGPAEIKLENAGGDIPKSVVVESTGQISVQ